jgi:hypothetical protein
MTKTEIFDVNASFPADPKHRVAIEALVAQAAEFAGCSAAVAKDFADEVGAAFVAGASTALPDTPVAVRVECAPTQIEVIVSCGQTVRMSRPIAIPS